MKASRDWGTSFQAVVNTRPVNDGFAFNLSSTLQKIANGVSAWPGYDLF